ncbi:BON domain-containing protein [Ramlibacter sp. XY19]|uniref:BON domain-containing protein n=1 Tax=Ramlibacter paludis TaxID=2908000 RepID=UPI0023DC972F|nr:BON domain-containing protein [Ramlibacter paludis]MCG2591656.1 BON domain-containing protein [Ramlibacter paludis]
MKLRPSSLATRVLAAALLGATLAGCAPLIIGGAAVGTAMMATDRRSSGAQIEDESIEIRAASRLRDALGDRVHINVTSYNRQVLLTGEVPSDAARQQAEQLVSRVDNVRGVSNELAVLPASSMTQRSADTFITGQIRASYVDAADLQSNAFKVVTERGTVYLMGRVSQREADRGTQIARQIGGVNKVVRMFEVLTPEEMRQLGLTPPGAAPAAAVAPAPAPAPAPAAPAATAPAPDAGGVVVSPVR